MLTREDRYFPEQFGAANQFGQTRHGFSTSRTSERTVALIVANMRQPSNASCGAIIVFNSQGENVEFRSRFDDRKDPEARVSPEVRDAVRALAQQCDERDDAELSVGGAVNT